MRYWAKTVVAALLAVSLLGCPTGSDSDSLTISPRTVELMVGQSTTFSVSSSNPSDSFTWESDDPSVATVNSRGRTTAEAAGTARITATGSVSGQSVTATVTVVTATDTGQIVTVSPSAATIAVGGTVSLEPATTGGPVSFFWFSVDETIATVAPNGVVTGVAVGSVEVVVRGASPDESASAVITVIEPESHAISVRPLGASIGVGEQVALTAVSTDPADEFVWGSDLESTATVDENGLVTGAGPGAVVISVEGTSSGAIGTAVINVTSPPEHRVTVSPTTITIGVGDVTNFQAITTRPGGTITWSSEDTTIATVGSNGAVTGVSVGTVSILAQGEAADERGVASVRVVQGRTRVANVRPLRASIPAGETVSLSATSNDITEAFEWTSADNAVATVNPNGLVTGVSTGEVQIIAVGENTGAMGSATIEVTPAIVHRVSISPSSADIETGESLRFTATSTRPGDRIAWSSDNEDAATVDETGRVTGTGPGSATVTAMGQDSGVSASASVTVTEPVAHEVVLNPLAARIAPDETITLVAQSTDPLDTFEWFSSDELVALVDQQGVVTGVAPGTAEITGFGRNSGETSTATITVSAVVEHEVQVLPTAASIELGGTVQLAASSTRSDDNMLWSSADEALATVDETGLVTGAGVGAVVITAEGSLSGATDAATITVTEPVIEEAIVRPLESSIFVGDSVTLSAESTDAEEDFAWLSEDEAVATVDSETGVVTGAGAGVATIRATGANTAATGTSSVTVMAPVDHEVNVAPAEVLLTPGDTVQMIANTTREGDTFTWSSSDTAVASISASGVVTAVGAGSATIMAQGSVENESDTAAVTVVDPIEHMVTVQPLGASIVAGTTVAFQAFSSDEQDAFTWTSSNTAVATVNANGVVTGVAAGTANIRARGSSSGITASATVTVTAPVVHFVTVQPPNATLEVGATQTLTANATNPDDSISWSSGSPAIASVGPSGLVTALGVGSATITATGSSTGLTDTSVITVVDTVAPTIAVSEPAIEATRGGPLEYKVTYGGANAITLTKANVTLHTTGSASALLGNVTTTAANERTVNVNTVAGDGTLSISIAAGTASDAAGNMAPGVGPTASIIVDNSAPTLAIGAPSAGRTNTGPINYPITYAGANAISLAKANVMVNGTGTVAAVLGDVTGTGSASRTVTFSSLTGDGTIGFSIAQGTATDAAGNRAAAAGPSTQVVVDNTPPSVTISAPTPTAINIQDEVTFRVTYDGHEEITLSSADIIENRTGIVVVGAPPVVTESGENERTITFGSVGGDGTLAISLAAGTAVDAAGNLALAAGPSPAVTVDNTPPSLTIGLPVPPITSAGPVVIPVTYQGADEVTLSEEDIQMTGTGTASALVDSVTDAGGGLWNVTLGGVIGNGTVTMTIAPGTASDNAGNTAPGAGPSTAFSVNNIVPTLAISDPSAETTFEEPITYTVTYADAQTVSLNQGDVTLNSPDGVTADIAVTGTGTTQRTITLSNFSGPGEVTIALAADTARNNAMLPALAAGPSMPFRVHPLLEPGTGFTEPTPQPDPIGNPGDPGIDAKAIARWDVVPYQTFEEYFEIGVVAFHINDIDRVEFSVDGGPWLAVEEMTVNPRTDVVEYWVGLDARDFADGPIEVRAVAYPVVGVPRVLQGTDVTVANGEYSTHLYGNVQGTLTGQSLYVSLDGDDGNIGSREHPLATITQALNLIKASGEEGFEVVILDAGVHQGVFRGFGSQRISNERWIEVRPDDGLPDGSVTIDFDEETDLRPGADRMIWKDLRFNFGKIRQYYGLGQMVWFDNVVWFDEFGWLHEKPSNVRGTYYVTNSTAQDMLFAFTQADLVRNCSASSISGDALQNSKVVFNTTVDNIDGSVLEHHSDLYQIFRAADNYIVYGVAATRLNVTQAIFLEPTFASALGADRLQLTNSAFVNLDIENVPVFRNGLNFGTPPASQMLSSFSHVLFRDVRLPEQRFLLRTDLVQSDTNQWFEAHNVRFERFEFHPLTWEIYSDEANWPPGVRFEECYAGVVATSN